MSELRKCLRKVLENNTMTASLLSPAVVFLMIYPVLFLLTKFTYIGIYYSLSALIYVLFLVGIVLCFAIGSDTALAIAFAMLAIAYFKTIINYFDFNMFVYFIFYTVLAVASYRNRGNTQSADKSGVKADEAVKICPGCGQSINARAKFCPFCGNGCQLPYESVVKAQRNSTDYDGFGKIVVELCSSQMALAFNVLLSAYLICDIFCQFSFATLLSHIPMIAICIGSWMVYVGCSNGQPKTSGFTVINTVLVIQQIFATLPWIFIFIIGMMLLPNGESVGAVGVFAILAAVVGAGVVTVYWKGMRRTSVQARSLLRGERTEWSASLLIVVLTSFEAIKKTIILLTQSGSNYAMNSIVDNLTEIIYDTTGSSFLAEYAYRYLASAFGINNSDGLQVLISILGIAVPVCAVMILCRIRKCAGDDNQ